MRYIVEQNDDGKWYVRDTSTPDISHCFPTEPEAFAAAREMNEADTGE